MNKVNLNKKLEILGLTYDTFNKMPKSDFIQHFKALRNKKHPNFCPNTTNEHWQDIMEAYVYVNKFYDNVFTLDDYRKQKESKNIEYIDLSHYFRGFALNLTTPQNNSYSSAEYNFDFDKLMKIESLNKGIDLVCAKTKKLLKTIDSFSIKTPDSVLIEQNNIYVKMNLPDIAFQCGAKITTETTRKISTQLKNAKNLDEKIIHLKGEGLNSESGRGDLYILVTRDRKIKHSFIKRLLLKLGILEMSFDINLW